MELPIYQIDAFSDRQFAGNPAAVVPLENWLSDDLLLKIAAENNLAETAYFIPSFKDGADFEIRWFTPVLEVELCGHATLAASAVIFREMGWDGDEIRFETRQAGPLSVKRDGDRFVLDFPSRKPSPAVMPDGLADAIGIQPVEFHRAMKNLAVLESPAQVLAVQPDLAYVANMEADGLVITARGDDCDCVSRYFAPHAGIPEDPVTGSAHCMVVPFWAERLDREEIHARQVSARGGDLYCTLRGDRVLLAGEAALYMKGVIYL